MAAMDAAAFVAKRVQGEVREILSKLDMAKHIPSDMACTGVRVASRAFPAFQDSGAHKSLHTPPHCPVPQLTLLV